MFKFDSTWRVTVAILRGHKRKDGNLKRLNLKACASLMWLGLSFLVVSSTHAKLPVFTAQEKQIILSFAAQPKQLDWQQRTDPTNQFADNLEAKKLGKSLFFDPRLSANGSISCASCHDFEQGLADGRIIAKGLAVGSKNTPTLINVFMNRWFFWDGRADSLWSQAAGPIEDKREMGGNWPDIYQLFINDPALLGAYNSAFQQYPIDAKQDFGQADLKRFKVNIGKALGAFQMDLIQFNSPFDEFVLSLSQGELNNKPSKPPLSADELHGLKIFIGKGKCNQCHFGANFTDGEFHAIRLQSAVTRPQETGRYGALALLKKDIFNSHGPYSDNPSEVKTQYLMQQQNQWAAFKTPTLRSVAQTAPYMHDGSMSTLRDVIEHYSRFENAAPAHHGNGELLTPLNLNETEIEQLEAFLKSLSGTTSVPEY